MRDTARTIVLVAAIILIVGLVAYARGAAHHRGTEVGEHPAVTLSLAG